MRNLTDKNRLSARGFTVLELMVATSIFAVVLLVLTVGVLSFSRDYFSSVTRSNTQAVARSIIDEVSHAVQFAQAPPTSPSTTGKTTAICVDNVMYSYAIGQKVSDTSGSNHQSLYGMIKTLPSASCGSPPVDITGVYAFDKDTQHELLGKNMRISAFSITPDGNNTFTVRVRVAYGEDDLFGISGGVDPADWSKIVCKNGTGSQFCAISDLTTTVQQRITN